MGSGWMVKTWGNLGACDTTMTYLVPMDPLHPLDPTGTSRPALGHQPLNPLLCCCRCSGALSTEDTMTRQTLEDFAAVACIAICMTLWMFV